MTIITAIILHEEIGLQKLKKKKLAMQCIGTLIKLKKNFIRTDIDTFNEIQKSVIKKISQKPKNIK